MRRAKTLAEKFWPNVTRGDGCWEWTGCRDRDGYGVVCLYGGGRSRTLRANRAAWEITHGPVPSGFWVLHRCDNRACVRPEHLYLGDVQQNMRDMLERDRVARGEVQGLARLTVDHVREIRALSVAGVRGTEIAARFGVHKNNVYQIVARQTWRHVS